MCFLAKTLKQASAESVYCFYFCIYISVPESHDIENCCKIQYNWEKVPFNFNL